MVKNYGYLKYIIENCKEALTELCSMNQKLKDSLGIESRLNSNQLGILNRVLRDYLVIRISGLFDKDSRTISLINSDLDCGEIDKIRQETIINKLIMERDKGVAHSEEKYVMGEVIRLYIDDIINSNLKDLLTRIELILENNK